MKRSYSKNGPCLSTDLDENRTSEVFGRKVDLWITQSDATVSAALQINGNVGLFAFSTLEVQDILLVLCSGIFQQLSLLSGVKLTGWTSGLTFYSRSEL